MALMTGQRFKLFNRETCESSEYILAQVAPFSVALIHLESGNRFNDPVKVENPTDLTAKEWLKVCYLGEDMSYDFHWDI